MQAWQDFLKAQEKECGKGTVDKWLRPLKIIHFDAGNLYLEANDPLHLAWFEEQMRYKVQKELLNNNQRPIKVHLTIGTESTLGKKKGKGKKSSTRPFTLSFDPIDPQATFAQFVFGSNNQLLQKLVEEEKELSFNPLYLYGDAGVGKTHFLMALAHRLREKGLKTQFIHTETFTEHVVNAIRLGNMEEFRGAYRHLDALLIDDIHLLARRGATQEEFFHTFNSLHTAGRHIFLSSLYPPSLLREIEPRLVSRFEWGIALQLEKLQGEEMRTVLQNRCAALGLQLQETVQNFLLTRFSSHPRALHKAIDATLLRLHLKGNSLISLREIEILLSDLLEEEKQKALTAEKITRTVANFYGLSSEEILGKSQTQECALARQIAMYICRKELKIPFMKIGEIFGRDHSTVMSSVKNIQQKIGLL